jgi:prepilin-type N-terminal cleavage/methylation domain-containing protein
VSRPRPAPVRGFTLLELLVVIIVMVGVMTATVGFLRSQNQSFLNGSRRLDAIQNARFAVSQVERELRTLGAGVTGQQPMLVYGGNDVVAFNTDYVENDTTNFRWAVYFNPLLPSATVEAWRVTDAALIPNTTYTYPPINYLQSNGAISPAETHIFWMSPDSSTARTDDYVLYERVNSGSAEVVSRNILQMPGRPFFEYFLARRLTTGADTMLVTPSALLPLKRLPLTTGMTSADSANAVRPDSIKAIRINIRITNGLSGADERTRDYSSMVALPNNGMIMASICGRTPFGVASLTATPDTVAGSGRVRLDFGASPDQESGEGDVWQYIVYRRVNGATLWEDPLMNLAKTTGATTYSVWIGGNTPGTVYNFGLSAQDCTPAVSTITSVTVTAP